MARRKRDFKAERKAMLRRILRYADEHGVAHFGVVCPPLNDDVPKFLKELDEFHRKSRKSKLEVCAA